MLRLDPHQRLAADPGAPIKEQRPSRCRTIQHIAEEHADGHKHGESPAVDAPGAQPSYTHLKSGKAQRRRKQPHRGSMMYSELPRPAGRLACQPGCCTIQKNQVQQWRDHIPNQSFAVPPEPVPMPSGDLPPAPLPRLQCDPHDPPRPLPYRPAEGVREIFARGHEPAAFTPQRHEDLGPPERMDAPAVFVVFGQALRIEHPVGVRFGETFQDCSRKPSAYPVPRKKDIPHLPNGDILGLKLRELVAIQAMYPISECHW